MSTLSVRASLVGVAALLAFAAALQDGSSVSWPSLEFRFSVKRVATQIHGYSDFSVFANPRVLSRATTHVLYDTFTSFTEDNTVFNYSLVDSVAYVCRECQAQRGDLLVSCMDADTLPPINSIVTALCDAKPASKITAGDGSVIPCTSGYSYKVSVDGVDFGMCYYGSRGFKLFGSDMDIKVEYKKKRLPIQAPKLDDRAKTDCEQVAMPSPVTSIGESFLTGKPVSAEERILEKAFGVFLNDQCSCQSTPRPCLFIHGLGVHEEKEENVDSFAYWGNLTGHTPCCTSIKYTKLDTMNSSWTDKLLQEKVCDRALSVSNSSYGSTIADTIIITHSMGGLMVAGAIANKRCKLANSTTWVTAGSPLLGSMASDYVQQSCKNNTNLLMETYADRTRLCPAGKGIKSIVYQNESFCSLNLNTQYKAAQKAYQRHVYAAMCSNSYIGVLSSYQLRFWVAGRLIPHKSLENDGVVEFSSCAGGIPVSKFGDDYRNRFYVTGLNHFDVSFKAGDSLLDNSKMPVKWFECLL
ncbi:unnamed protein product [Hyaloperonospora brassicae]|uniref:GPI inositol-deacylase n=1 Tax=Hyaloperonospora brassicae TaxID=162125 RepID=A0AAV0TNC5_HYABA|nr:unnamed protein product [Hyaloperonospora brassicae]